MNRRHLLKSTLLAPIAAALPAAPFVANEASAMPEPHIVRDDWVEVPVGTTTYDPGSLVIKLEQGHVGLIEAWWRDKVDGELLASIRVVNSETCARYAWAVRDIFSLDLNLLAPPALDPDSNKIVPGHDLWEDHINDTRQLALMGAYLSGVKYQQRSNGMTQRLFGGLSWLPSPCTQNRS